MAEITSVRASPTFPTSGCHNVAKYREIRKFCKGQTTTLSKYILVTLAEFTIQPRERGCISRPNGYVKPHHSEPSGQRISGEIIAALTNLTRTAQVLQFTKHLYHQKDTLVSCRFHATLIVCLWCRSEITMKGGK